MTARTRYFVVVSLAVMGVGIGTGLVAYHAGFSTSVFFARGGPDELRLVPRTSAVVSFADVGKVMRSDLRQRLRRAVSTQLQENGQQEFEKLTGINIETDIDHVVASLEPSGTNMPGAGLVLARGRFNEGKIEALMREHGATVEDYKGKRLIVAHPNFTPPIAGPNATPPVPNPNAAPIPNPNAYSFRQPPSFSLVFVQPGLAALGATELVRRTVDLQTGGGESAATNDELMAQIRGVDNADAWAVGRFDVLRAQVKLPPGVASQLPPITWFAVSEHIDSGLRGTIRAEARDDEAAANLREVIRGFLALAKLQAGSKPEFQRLLQSIELGGVGKNVALSFDIPGEVFDLAGAARKPLQPQH